MSTRNPNLIEKQYTTEEYTTERLVPAPSFYGALISNPQVAAYLLIALGLIFAGYDYFAQHGTNAQALLAALVIGSFIWAAFKPENGA